MKITSRPLEPQVPEAIRTDEADTGTLTMDRDAIDSHSLARTADNLTKIAKSLDSLVETMESVSRALWEIAPERIAL